MPVARHLLFTPGVSQKGPEPQRKNCRLESFPPSSENDFVIFPRRYIALNHKVMRWEPQSYLRYVGHCPGVLRRPGHLLELNPRELAYPLLRVPGKKVRSSSDLLRTPLPNPLLSLPARWPPSQLAEREVAGGAKDACQHCLSPLATDICAGSEVPQHGKAQANQAMPCQP